MLIPKKKMALMIAMLSVTSAFAENNQTVASEEQAVIQTASVAENQEDNTQKLEEAEEKPSFWQQVKSKFSRKKQSDHTQQLLEPKFPVTIEVDNIEIEDMVAEHLPLITQQTEEELDEEQMSFLAEEAPAQILEMLKTKGYFGGSAQVLREGNGYLVKIQTGKQTHIDNVSVAIVGDVLSDTELGEYYKSAMENWSLPVGAPFSQSEWSNSKTAVLSAVKRKKYPLAVLQHTQATVNPEKHTADIDVMVDSNRPIYFGAVNISGTKRYPESIVRGLAQFSEGSPYDLDKLLDYQQALEQDSHYSGASVQADWDNLQGDHVPVKVEVSETKRQKLELGIRYDSEYGVGGRIAYDYYDLFGKGYIGSVVADADKYQTTVAVGISQPRNGEGKYWTSSLSYERSTVQQLETHSLSSGIWYVRDRNGIESRLGLEYISESSRIPEKGIKFPDTYATMLTASWKRQNIESQMRPENGYYLDGKIGSTLGKLGSSSSMQRATARAGYYFTPENKKLGTFVTRAQMGYIYTGETYGVPSTLRFRTGGATTVRGYELDSIGIDNRFGNTVIPARALAVGSVEYQYPITKSFSGAIFHDFGGAANRFQDMKLKHGTGLGVRWFSPMAPFSFDIAYGHDDKKIRWHISLGTRF